MTQVCAPVTVGGLFCVQCPEVIGVTGVPEQIIATPVYGWNASAHSAATIAGDAFVEFAAPECLGLVCGLASAHVGSDPRDIPFGFYIRRESGRSLWSVVESSIERTTPVVRDLLEEFRVERRGSIVTYFVNERVVYTSEIPMVGVAIVVSCLFGSGDGVE